MAVAVSGVAKSLVRYEPYATYGDIIVRNSLQAGAQTETPINWTQTLRTLPTEFDFVSSPALQYKGSYVIDSSIISPRIDGKYTVAYRGSLQTVGAQSTVISNTFRIVITTKNVNNVCADVDVLDCINQSQVSSSGPTIFLLDAAMSNDNDQLALSCVMFFAYGIALFLQNTLKQNIASTFLRDSQVIIDVNTTSRGLTYAVGNVASDFGLSLWYIASRRKPEFSFLDEEEIVARLRGNTAEFVSKFNKYLVSRIGWATDLFDRGSSVPGDYGRYGYDRDEQGRIIGPSSPDADQQFMNSVWQAKYVYFVVDVSNPDSEEAKVAVREAKRYAALRLQTDDADKQSEVSVEDLPRINDVLDDEISERASQTDVRELEQLNAEIKLTEQQIEETAAVQAERITAIATSNPTQAAADAAEIVTDLRNDISSTFIQGKKEERDTLSKQLNLPTLNSVIKIVGQAEGTVNRIPTQEQILDISRKEFEADEADAITLAAADAQGLVAETKVALTLNNLLLTSEQNEDLPEVDTLLVETSNAITPVSDNVKKLAQETQEKQRAFIDFTQRKTAAKSLATQFASALDAIDANPTDKKVKGYSYIKPLSKIVTLDNYYKLPTISQQYIRNALSVCFYITLSSFAERETALKRLKKLDSVEDLAELASELMNRVSILNTIKSAYWGSLGSKGGSKQRNGSRSFILSFYSDNWNSNGSNFNGFEKHVRKRLALFVDELFANDTRALKSILFGEETLNTVSNFFAQTLSAKGVQSRFAKFVTSMYVPAYPTRCMGLLCTTKEYVEFLNGNDRRPYLTLVNDMQYKINILFKRNGVRQEDTPRAENWVTAAARMLKLKSNEGDLQIQKSFAQALEWNEQSQSLQNQLVRIQEQIPTELLAGRVLGTVTPIQPLLIAANLLQFSINPLVYSSARKQIVEAISDLNEDVDLKESLNAVNTFTGNFILELSDLSAVIIEAAKVGAVNDEIKNEIQTQIQSIIQVQQVEPKKKPSLIRRLLKYVNENKGKVAVMLALLASAIYLKQNSYNDFQGHILQSKLYAADLYKNVTGTDITIELASRDAQTAKELLRRRFNPQTDEEITAFELAYNQSLKHDYDIEYIEANEIEQSLGISEKPKIVRKPPIETQRTNIGELSTESQFEQDKTALFEKLKAENVRRGTSEFKAKLEEFYREAQGKPEEYFTSETREVFGPVPLETESFRKRYEAFVDIQSMQKIRNMRNEGRLREKMLDNAERIFLQKISAETGLNVEEWKQKFGPDFFQGRYKELVDNIASKPLFGKGGERIKLKSSDDKLLFEVQRQSELEILNENPDSSVDLSNPFNNIEDDALLANEGLIIRGFAEEAGQFASYDFDQRKGILFNYLWEFAKVPLKASFYTETIPGFFGWKKEKSSQEEGKGWGGGGEQRGEEEQQEIEVVGDPFKVLGLDRNNKNLTQRDIAKAYKTLARVYHPDRNPTNPKEAERKFRALDIARQALDRIITNKGERPMANEPTTTARAEDFFAEGNTVDNIVGNLFLPGITNEPYVSAAASFGSAGTPTVTAEGQGRRRCNHLNRKQMHSDHLREEMIKKQLRIERFKHRITQNMQRFVVIGVLRIRERRYLR